MRASAQAAIPDVRVEHGSIVVYTASDGMTDSNVESWSSQGHRSRSSAEESTAALSSALASAWVLPVSLNAEDGEAKATKSL